MIWIKNKIKEKSFFLTNIIYQYMEEQENCSVREEHITSIFGELWWSSSERVRLLHRNQHLKLSIRPGRGLAWNPPEANDASFLNRVCYSFMYVLLWECIRTTRMLLICARMYSNVTRMYSYVTRMCSYVTRMCSYVLARYSYVPVSYSCARMLLVCARMYSYVTHVLVCTRMLLGCVRTNSYVERMYSYVTMC